MGTLEDLYREELLSRYRFPQKLGELPGATHTKFLENPTCGDKITLFLKVNDGHVESVRFVGEGCAISRASADLMAEAVEGRPLDEVRRLIKAFKAMVVEGRPPAPELGPLAALAGVARVPSRVGCAVLPWKALEAILEEG